MSDDMRKTLRDMLDEVDRYFEEFEKEVQDGIRERLSGAKLFQRPFVAGFQMRVSPEGRPSVQFFGDNPQQADGYRSPMAEQIVDEKAGTLRLVADLPGVEKADINLSATEESAVIKAERENRKYKSETKLRAQVDPESGKAEFKNGVLEISFTLKDKNNKAFRRVNVV